MMHQNVIVAAVQRRYNKLSRRQKMIAAGSIVGTFALVMLLTIIFHKRILDWAKPLAQKYTQRPGGFLLPSCLLIVVSFPPLFGTEFISILTGFVYGNLGFLIVLVATTIGDSLLFLSFRYAFRSKLAAFKEQYQNYAIFVSVIEEGGFPMLLAIRFSAVPSHFSTPLFASVLSIEYRYWLLAVVLSSPGLYPPVYFGWLLQRGQSSQATPWLIGIAGLITLGVGAYIYVEYRRHQKALGPRLEARRQRAALMDLEEQADLLHVRNADESHFEVHSNEEEPSKPAAHGERDLL
ncbi:hypothetical protein BCR37DRAFT_415468 [Protomyces lactucae-debilis]|uniref:Golgi apparatus membrane protein TVP38 n=1 Tax=Protomyces lactucae-debilis TaxID=2754530 RepID=A0A1Y2EYI0_PROLT|nr:uncharacterized protein BCR37DRAFT_415468 [Protomyces lactucae-debilis]ORY76691.1 hypothetical protein BCR37DRAFT_415468 [Protomyces lactucae-debilis]